jgi:molybdenum cofactor synthesis domain-containing protein
MAAQGFREALRGIMPDETDLISARLRDWCDGGEVDLILTTGGTGLAPRDVTPEATRAVIDLEVPGIAEAMRMQTLDSTPMAMLSRSVAGVRSGCLIVNLPGSPAGVRETLEVALMAIPHALEMIRGWRTHLVR